MGMEDISHKHEMIKRHQQRLQELELKAASFGMNCPPEITIEINNIIDAVTKLQEEMKGESEKLNATHAQEQTAKILVIDDEPSMTHMLNHFLTREGYTVITANGGIEGLHAASVHSPDIVLLDIAMPDMNGFLVLAKLVERKIRTRVIVVSGMKTPGISILLGTGACDYIRKPFERATLRNAIRRALEISPTIDVISRNPIELFNNLLVKIDELFWKNEEQKGKLIKISEELQKANALLQELSKQK